MTLLVFVKEFLKKLILKKVSRKQQRHEKLPSMLIVKDVICGVVFATYDFQEVGKLLGSRSDCFIGSWYNTICHFC